MRQTHRLAFLSALFLTLISSAPFAIAGFQTPRPAIPPAPPDIAAPPPDAEKTASGVASKVLAQGTGRTEGIQ